MKRFIPSVMMFGLVLLMPNIAHAQEQKQLATEVIQKAKIILPSWRDDFYLPFPETWKKTPMKERPPLRKDYPTRIFFSLKI